MLESMKMEFPISADNYGVIKKIYIKESEQVNAGQVLAAIKIQN